MTAGALSIIGLVISALALAVSVVTAWLTLLRRGRVRMTQPTVIYFGPDGGLRDDSEPPAMKVFLRTLLYSTGKRGQIAENMFVRLQRGESRQNLNIWNPVPCVRRPWPARALALPREFGLGSAAATFRWSRRGQDLS